MMMLESVITCPQCGFASTETMATDACEIVYRCHGCGATLRPAEGDCCVYCTYGTVPCPPIQQEQAARQEADDARDMHDRGAATT